MLAVFDVCGLSKIGSAKCAHRGLIITKVTLLLMDFKAKKVDSNEDITARIILSKFIRK